MDGFVKKVLIPNLVNLIVSNYETRSSDGINFSRPFSERLNGSFPKRIALPWFVAKRLSHQVNPSHQSQ